MTVALRIERARDGGFVVLSTNSYGEMTTVLFAGSLAECLDYMRRTFEAKDE